MRQIESVASELASIVESASDFVFSCDASGAITFVSASVEMVTGFNPGQWATRYDAHFTGNPLNREAREFTEQTLKTGNVYPPFDIEISAQGGEPVTIEISQRAAIEKGRPQGIIGIGRNVTDRRRAEKLQRGRNRVMELIADDAPLDQQILAVIKCIEEVVPDMIAVIHLLEKRTLHVIAAPTLPRFFREAIDHVAIGPEVDSSGAAAYTKELVVAENIATHPNWRALRHPALRAGLESACSLPIISGSDLVVGTFTAFWKYRCSPDSRRLEIIHSATQIAGIAIERSLVSEERGLLERQLRQSQKLETIGTLAGGIAHDFNNILQAITGHAEMAIAEVESSGTILADLQAIHKAATRARDLVKQILTFSRGGDRELRPIQIGRVVTETLDMIRISKPSSIQFIENIKENCPPVQAEESQIHQIVTNLCSNAFHAMREKGGVLRVTLDSRAVEPGLAREHSDLHPGMYNRLSFADTGDGMDRSTLDRVFEPFFTTKKVGEGVGLGLSVVHGIVSSHSGAILIESGENSGTTFHIYLPEA